MTQDEIIEMARQAGIIAIHTEGDGNWHQQFVALEAFAKLVAAKAFQDGYEKGIAAFNEAVLIEREACAKLCESHGTWDNTETIAKAIRARGQQ